MFCSLICSTAEALPVSLPLSPPLPNGPHPEKGTTSQVSQSSSRDVNLKPLWWISESMRWVEGMTHQDKVSDNVKQQISSQ